MTRHLFQIPRAGFPGPLPGRHADRGAAVTALSEVVPAPAVLSHAGGERAPQSPPLHAHCTTHDRAVIHCWIDGRSLPTECDW